MVIDPYGILLGMLTFLLLYTIALLVLNKHQLAYQNIVTIMSMGLIGHFCCSIAYFYFAKFNGADATNYFYDANNQWGTGTQFICFFTYWVRKLLSNDSLIGTYFIYTSFSFIANLIYFLVFISMLKQLPNQHKVNVTWPCLFFFCWPSSLFFTSTIGKDSLISLFLSLLLLCVIKIKIQNLYKYLGVLSASMIYIVRPYLAPVLLIGGILTVFMQKKIKLKYKIVIILIIMLTTYLLYNNLRAFFNLSSLSMDVIVERAIRQRNALATGSNFNLPTSGSYWIYFSVPYAIFANLCYPLFFNATNFFTFITSFQNLFILFVIYKMVVERKLLFQLMQTYPHSKFLFCYFLAGMALLGLYNTNMGLAEREKLMYLPSLIIVFFLVQIAKKYRLLSVLS